MRHNSNVEAAKDGIHSWARAEQSKSASEIALYSVIAIMAREQGLSNATRYRGTGSFYSRVGPREAHHTALESI